MKNLIRKDLFITYISNKNFYIMLLIIPILLFIIGDYDANIAFLYSVVTLTYMCTRVPFVYGIKDKPHLFIQSLPVTKVDIVISKYISIFINFTISSILTTVYLFILSPFNFVDITALKFSSVVLTFSTNIILTSISFPTEFIFTPKVANFVNMMIYIIFLNFFILGSKPLLNLLRVFFNYRLGMALIVGLVYFLSMSISIVVYKNRNFY